MAARSRKEVQIDLTFRPWTSAVLRVGTFVLFGHYDGQYEMGHDIAADRKGDLNIVDITGRRVQKFAPRR